MNPNIIAGAAAPAPRHDGNAPAGGIAMGAMLGLLWAGIIYAVGLVY